MELPTDFLSLGRGSVSSGYDWIETVPHRQYPETVRCVYSLGSIRKKV